MHQHAVPFVWWSFCMKCFSFSMMLTLVVALFCNGLQLTAADADPAVERARKQVAMLDDLYKTAVVLVTENYVKDESDLAAGSAFKLLFEAMKKKGHHEARLVDATGAPYEPANAPQDAFEKEAIAAIKAGKPYFDQVVVTNGKKELRAATIIPVVLKKCTMCHENYNKAKPGEAIGALMYRMPIE
jgi:Protein of unknown function (DUF3365)